MNVRDTTAMLLSKYRKLVDRDYDLALEQGIINADGVIIDTREKIGGRDNPNYLGPLENSPSYLIKTITGICQRATDGLWDSFEMIAFGDAAKRLGEIPMLTPLAFRAIERSTGPYSLGVSRVTKFKILEGEKWDIGELLSKHGRIKSLVEFKRLIGERQWYRFMADVSEMNLTVTAAGNRILTLTDENLDIEEDVIAFVPQWIPINFGEDSRIIVTGVPGTYRNRLSINVYGLYPIWIVESKERKEYFELA